MSDRDDVRLELGDTDAADVLFSDSEIQYFLDAASGDVLLATARACDSLARRFARDFDFSTDGQSFSKGQRSEHYRLLAKELRLRAAGGVTSETVTRVDGYSTDIPSDQVTAGRGANGGNQRGRQNWFTQDDQVY